MTGILSLHDLRHALYDTPVTVSLSLVTQADLDRAAYTAWLNDPGSADEWPYREPVGGEDATPEDDDTMKSDYGNGVPLIETTMTKVEQ